MNNAELIVRTLRAAGVSHGFGIPSGNVLPMLEAMRVGGLPYVLTAHEGSAAFAADVMGRMTGVPHMPGTREYLTCETGEIVLAVAGEQWRLAPGDVMTFRGDQRHSYANPGSRPAVGYSVVLLAPVE